MSSGFHFMFTKTTENIGPNLFKTTRRRNMDISPLTISLDPPKIGGQLASTNTRLGLSAGFPNWHPLNQIDPDSISGYPINQEGSADHCHSRKKKMQINNIKLFSWGEYLWIFHVGQTPESIRKKPYLIFRVPSGKLYNITMENHHINGHFQ